MQLLDNALKIEAEHGTDAAFPQGFAAFVRSHGLPRATAYRHRERVKLEGRWQPRSRAPRNRPNATPERVRARVIALREELGPDNGADMIRAALLVEAAEQDWASQGLVVPARSTINAILDRAGLLTKTPRKRPRSSYRRFVYARPRDCYQIDGTTITGLPVGRVCVIEVLDDCTRTLVATRACWAETTKDAMAAVNAAIASYGAPAIVLSDNGTAFSTTARRGGTQRSRFAQNLDRHGVRLIHSSPYHPQTCGKVERHHQTFNKWLAASGHQPQTLTHMQALCDQYQDWYNTQRWHSAIRATPAATWANAPALGGPTSLPAQTDAHIYAARVDKSGRVWMHGTSITIGRAHTGQTMTVVIDGQHANVHDHDGHHLGHLTLDRERRNQGQLIA